MLLWLLGLGYHNSRQLCPLQLLELLLQSLLLGLRQSSLLLQRIELLLNLSHLELSKKGVGVTRNGKLLRRLLLELLLLLLLLHLLLCHLLLLNLHLLLLDLLNLWNLLDLGLLYLRLGLRLLLSDLLNDHSRHARSWAYG